MGRSREIAATGWHLCNREGRAGQHRLHRQDVGRQRHQGQDTAIQQVRCNRKKGSRRRRHISQCVRRRHIRPLGFGAPTGGDRSCRPYLAPLHRLCGAAADLGACRGAWCAAGVQLGMTCNKSPTGRAKRTRGGVTMSQKRRLASFSCVPCTIMPLAICGPLRRCSPYSASSALTRHTWPFLQPVGS